LQVRWSILLSGSYLHLHRVQSSWSEANTNKRSLTQVLALKFGYDDVEKMKVDSKARFSLLENGIIDQPSCRLLLINVRSFNPSLSLHLHNPFQPSFNQRQIMKAKLTPYLRACSTNSSPSRTAC
jgi:hypothetical protein